MGAKVGEVERWFIRRGVPHFIDEYTPTTDIWNRSLPMLVIAYLAGGLNALDLHTWTWQRNAAMAIIVVLVLLGGWIVVNLALSFRLNILGHGALGLGVWLGRGVLEC